MIQDIVGRHESNENSGLFGLRKSGKTSIVFGVERLLRTKGSTHVTIDCENPSFHMLRWNELLHRIVELLRGAKQSSYKISSIDEYTEKDAGRKFEEDVLGIYNSRKKQATLLIFDEIERISPNTGSSPHWREGDDFVYFWQVMRYFFQRYSEVISYLLVGTNPACVEQPKIGIHDNPLFSSIPFQYVPPFDVQKTREMVRKLGRYMGLKFEEGIYTLLTYDFGGHPFLIRQMCSAINAQCTGPRPTQIDRILYDRAKEKFIRDSMHYLEMIVEVLRKDYPDEYQMLSFLADGDMNTFEYYATDAPYLITHLIGYGLIQASPAGYGFNIECIRNYIQSKNRYTNARLTPEQKIAEISERRNSLEKKLRQLIKNQIKAAYGRKKASDIILNSLPENRRNDLRNRDVDYLLHRDSSPLFFLDLRNIVLREWSMFENIFEIEKEKLRIMLDDINAGRVDAHSKLVEDDLFAQLRLHFKKLESVLDDWV